MRSGTPALTVYRDPTSRASKARFLTGPQPHALTLFQTEKRTGLPATASGRGVNTMGNRVTARGLARLLPLAFFVALPSLVSATPAHRDGAPSARSGSSDQPGHAGEARGTSAVDPVAPGAIRPRFGAFTSRCDQGEVVAGEGRDRTGRDRVGRLPVCAGNVPARRTAIPRSDRRCAGKGRPRSARRDQSRGQSGDPLRFGSEAARHAMSGALRSRPSPRDKGIARITPSRNTSPCAKAASRPRT